MIITSYKPRDGQLLLTPTLREYHLKYFKGVKPKPVRMSGALYKATMIDFIGAMQLGGSINELEHKGMMLDIISEFRKAMEGKDRVIKKRSYITGYSNKSFQLMLTQSIYPVPHLPWAGIVLMTLDVGIPGSKEQLIKYVSWEVAYNENVDDGIVDYYNAIIKRNVSVDQDLSEGLEDMIFEMVKPPENIEDILFITKHLSDSMEKMSEDKKMNELANAVSIGSKPPFKLHSTFAEQIVKSA